jgi:hypothetical protein
VLKRVCTLPLSVDWYWHGTDIISNDGISSRLHVYLDDPDSH